MNSAMRRLSSTAPRPSRPATKSAPSGKQKSFCTSMSSRCRLKPSAADAVTPCAARHCCASTWSRPASGPYPYCPAWAAS